MHIQGEQVGEREEWDEIEEFPNYLVSNWGNVYNMKRGEMRRQFLTQRGYNAVTIFKDGRPYTRSVALLVAKSFVPNPDERRFDSIISLDGNRLECYFENLMWRPRPFAIRYHKQFDEKTFLTHRRPVRNVDTWERFPRLQDATMKYGLIFNHAFIAVCNGEMTWPTMQRYTWENW